MSKTAEPSPPHPGPKPESPRQSPLVELSRCTVRLGRAEVLRDVTWTIEPGRHWAVMGGNGAGKSTLLRLVRGELHPAQGTGGSRTWNLGDGPDQNPLQARRRVALVSSDMQDLYLRRGWDMDGLTLAALGPAGLLFPHAQPSDDDFAAAGKAMSDMGAAHLTDKGIMSMSRGQLRLVLAARALASDPVVLACDEIMDGLDGPARKRLAAALHAASRRATIIFTSHRVGDLPAFLTHALVLDRGRVTAQGPMDEVLHRTGPGADGDSPRIPAPGNPALQVPEPPSALPVSNNSLDFVVDIRNARVRRAGKDVLGGVDLTVRPGERWAVFGPNGAGKSSLLGLVTGDLRPMAGGGVDWFGRRGPRDIWEVRRRLGLVSPELQAGYRYDVTGLELVLTGFFSSVSLYREPTPGQRKLARRALELAGVAEAASRPMRSLSYGQLRRLFIARAVVHEPDLLLLDEAGAGLDRPSRAALNTALDALAGTGRTMVMVTHRPLELPACISHGLILDQGRVLASGPISGILPRALEIIG